MKEIRAFNIKIHPLRKLDFLGVIHDAIKSNKQIVQSGINAASIVDIMKNPELAATYNNADLINIDGMSMVWALRFLGYTVPERVACPDLATDLMNLAEKNKYSIFLFGAKEANLLSAVGNVKADFPDLQIAGYRNGYFNADNEVEIVNQINKSGADILFLGMASPQKEIFVEKYKSQLQVKYMLGVGGFFDILSGEIKRAPVWMQSVGLEWLFRLKQEPKRLFQRYLKGNLTFIKLVFLEKRKTQEAKKIFV